MNEQNDNRHPDTKSNQAFDELMRARHIYDEVPQFDRSLLNHPVYLAVRALFDAPVNKWGLAAGDNFLKQVADAGLHIVNPLIIDWEQQNQTDSVTMLPANNIQFDGATNNISFIDAYGERRNMNVSQYGVLYPENNYKQEEGIRMRVMTDTGMAMEFTLAISETDPNAKFNLPIIDEKPHSAQKTPSSIFTALHDAKLGEDALRVLRASLPSYEVDALPKGFTLYKELSKIPTLPPKELYKAVMACKQTGVTRNHRHYLGSSEYISFSPQAIRELVSSLGSHIDEKMLGTDELIVEIIRERYYFLVLDPKITYHTDIREIPIFDRDDLDFIKDDRNLIIGLVTRLYADPNRAIKQMARLLTLAYEAKQM